MLKRYDAIALTLVVLAALILRVVHLGSQALWFDEAFSWAVTQLPLNRFLDVWLLDRHPVLYYVILKALLVLLPSSEFGLRIFSLLCSTGALLALLVYAARRWSIRAAIFAGLFFVLSSYDLYYAQEARMYTMLALVVLLAYILTIEIVQGRNKLLPVWALVNVIMVWTHVYGLFTAGVNVAFLLGFWGRHRFWQQELPFSGRRLFSSVACIIAGSLPVVIITLRYPDIGAGGGSIPQPQDLLSLYALVSVGLAPARTSFVDGTHLILPPFDSIQIGIWVLLGAVVSGLAACWGMIHAWKCGGVRRWEVLLSILLIVVPVCIAFGYAALMQKRVWALKPFLGEAYLYYLWCGIGLSMIRLPVIRRALAAAAIVVALLSIIPYYVLWQKSDAALAFRSFPLGSDTSMLLLDRGYLLPVPRYYLGPALPIAAMNGNALVEVPAELYGPYVPLSCDAPEFQKITTLYVWQGPLARIQQVSKSWPACVQEKELLVFENGAWVPVNR